MSELNVAIPSSGYNGIENELPSPERTVSRGQQNNIEKISQASPIVDKTVVDKQANEKNNEEKEAPLTATEVTETVDEMNSFLQSMNRNLSFSVDEQLGQSVIIVKDSESEEVIRQIPSEELVVLRKKMDDVVGILFDTKV